MAVRLCFDFSLMSDAERKRLEGLQKHLGLADIMNAITLEPAIITAVLENVEKPYEGWFENLTPEQRERLYDYIDKNKQDILRIFKY